MIDPQIVRQRLAENVGWCMQQRDISLAELGEATESHTTTIHRLRRAENDPAFTLVVRIAAHFGVSTDDFLLPPREFRRVYVKRQEAREPIPA